MNNATGVANRTNGIKWVIVSAVVLVGAIVPSVAIDDPLQARALSIAIVCVALWLSELVPSFVPTLLLWTTVPLLLASTSDAFSLRAVLSWSADPVMALFFGGFTLSVAASKYGLDAALAGFAIDLSRGRPFRLVALVAVATTFLSMWMSNIAAAAMMIVATRPLLAEHPTSSRYRSAMLLAIAFGADFGGIATPIGSGPNAIAISAVSRHQTITFLDWMIFAVPLTAILIVASLGFLYWKVRRHLSEAPIAKTVPRSIDRRGWMVGAIASAMIVLWLTEPLHRVPAAAVALGGAALFFLSGLLDRHDLARIDWGTLLLIAGGLGLGRLLEGSALVAHAAEAIPWNDIAPRVMLFALCMTSALLSSIMSNTGTATMLIPLATTISPDPSTAILVAIAASLGIPFIISTPPNAMVVGEGGVTSSDLLVPGLIIMLLGCLVIALTGPSVLRLVGIP